MNAFSTIQTVTNTVVAFCQKHSPEILTGLGIAGAVSTTVLAVKATPAALDDIKYAKMDKVFAENDDLDPVAMEKEAENVSLTPVETVKCCWKHYIPAVVAGLGSAACIIGAQHISLRRNAVIASAYALSEASLKEYKAKVQEVVGDKKADEIREAIHEDHLKANPVPSEADIPGEGPTLCFDPYSSRYFRSDMEGLRKKVNDANYYLTQNNRMFLNDWYESLGLETIKLGWDLSWRLEEGLIEFKPDTMLASSGVPCIVVDFINPPTYDTDKYY